MSTPAWFEPRGGRLAVSERTVFARFADLLDLRHRSVVEVGGSLPSEILQESEVREWWSIDPRNPCVDSEETGVKRCIRGVASRIPLPSGSMGAVFSCNAFQHIHDLPSALRELFRVLRPGGLVYANFGPIWSAPDGSHVEGVVVHGRCINFWDGAILPSWAHLILPVVELRRCLQCLHGPEIGAALADYISRSTWINRLTLPEYLGALAESRFDVVFARGCETFGYDYDPPALPGRWADLFDGERLQTLLQDEWRLDASMARVRDVELLLRRPR